MSAAVCWLRFCANVEPPSSASPANPSRVIRDRANTTRTCPAFASSRSPSAGRALNIAPAPCHSIFALAELVKVTVPSSPARGVTGMNDELMVTRTQLPPLHGPVTAAPAMSMQA